MSVLFDTERVNSYLNFSNSDSSSRFSMGNINCTHESSLILEAIKKILLECNARIPNSKVNVSRDELTDSIRISFSYYVPTGHYDKEYFLETLVKYQSLYLNIRSIDIYDSNDFKLCFRIQIENLKRQALSQFEKAMRMFYKYIEENYPREIRRRIMYNSGTSTRAALACSTNSFTSSSLEGIYNELNQNLQYDGQKLFTNWFTGTMGYMQVHQQDTYKVNVPNSLYRINVSTSDFVPDNVFYAWDTSSTGTLSSTYSSGTGIWYGYENEWRIVDPGIQEENEYLKRLRGIKIKAERRAENFLKELVHEIDFRNYKEKGFIQVVGESGNIYRLYRDNKTEILKHKRFENMEEGELIKRVDSEELIGRAVNNRIISPGEEVLASVKRLCIHSRRRAIPETDEVIARLLMIRHDERKFLKVAHVLN